MRLLVRGTLGVLFLLGAARVGYARCDPQGTDKAAVDAARAQRRIARAITPILLP